MLLISIPCVKCRFLFMHAGQIVPKPVIYAFFMKFCNINSYVLYNNSDYRVTLQCPAYYSLLFAFLLVDV